MQYKFILLIFLFLASCIESFDPELEDFENLLVVDALITNKKEEYRVKLSRAISSKDEIPEPVRNALVSVVDGSGTEYIFTEREDGNYYSDSTNFIARIGGNYFLRIVTSDGNHYESEVETMITVPEIDSLYYQIENQIIERDNKEHKGLSFRIDSRNQQENSSYLRWDYIEDWEFAVPKPIEVEFYSSDSITIIPIENHHCWKKEYSSSIKIFSTAENLTSDINGFQIAFISPALSDRFLIKYSMLMRQYSMSEEQYNFWNNIKSVSEETGDIFEKQPVTLNSNIRNVNNDGEKIIGYFQVSAVSEKRINIKLSDLSNKDLNFWRNSCRTFVYPDDHDDEPFPSLELAYEYYSVEYVLYSAVQDDSGGISELWFTPRRCADCRETGTLEPPAFWDRL